MGAGTQILFRMLLLSLLTELPLYAAAQGRESAKDEEVIRINVQLVQVDAQVLEKKTGSAIGSLGKEDFQLYEDGVQQKIAELSRDQLPLSVVLLFDLTDSVRPVLRQLGNGALEALQHLKPEDEVAVMVYAKSAQLLQDFSTNRELVVSAIGAASAMKSDEPAFFNEAIFQASLQLGKAKNPRSRRTIIWLTDNVPNIPGSKQHDEKEAFREAFETGAVVFTLLERSGESDFFAAAYTRNPMFIPLRMQHPPGDVHKYAERTGGEVMTSGKKDISAKLANMIDEIRTRYTIGYYPTAKEPKGKFCEIKIKIAADTEKREGKLVVRTKKGYYR